MAYIRDLAASGAILVAFIALIASFLLTPNSASSVLTLYCTGPPVTTLDPSNPHAQCFRIENGTFTEILDTVPAHGQYTILKGWVFPGVIESHGHVLQYGEMLESVSLFGAESMEEVRRRVREWLGRHQGEGYGTRGKWIRGIGWDQKYFGGVMPTASELEMDPELAGLYIMLDRVDVHCVLTSQKVLDLLSNPLPEAPPGGVVVTDPGPGVFCDNAMDGIIYPLAPKPDVEQKTRWLKTAMAELNKVGIAGVGDAGMRPDDISILEDMAEKGEMTIRVNVMLECPERNTFCPDEIKHLKLLASKNGLGENMLMLGGVKLFADGALGSWGAAMLEPYSDKPDTRGTMLISETELTSVVKKWFDAGFQVNIHAIGDRANRAAVDAFENVLGPDCDGCNEARRLRIEHAQIIHPDDQKRIAKMGIIPSIQPTHATSDMAYALDRLGSERLSHSAYRMSSLFPADSLSPTSKYPGPVLGSDFPVEPPNPFHGMYAAVTRLNPLTGTSPSGVEGWFPDEKLSLLQALLGFTKNGAYGWKKENHTGSIEIGKWADFVIVEFDIMGEEVLKSGGKMLKDVVVQETWVGGKKVWSARVEERENVYIAEWRLLVKTVGDVFRRWIGLFML